MESWASFLVTISGPIRQQFGSTMGSIPLTPSWLKLAESLTLVTPTNHSSCTL